MNTLIRFLIAILFLLHVNTVWGQDKTYLSKSEINFKDTIVLDTQFRQLLLIPFDPKLYRSEIDREIGEYNQLNFQEVRGYFRLGLDNALNLALKDKIDVVRMHADDAEINRDLMHVYASIGYDAREIVYPKEPTKNPIQLTKNKLEDRKKDKAPKEGTRIENGQLVTVTGNTDKFMATRILNPDLIPKFSAKYSGALFLFINQLDLVRDKNVDYRAYEQGNYYRKIRVHFSLYDHKQNELISGIIMDEFSAEINDIRDIIANHFTKVATKIANELPTIAP